MSKGKSGLFGNNVSSSQGSSSKSANGERSSLSNYQKKLIKTVQARGEKITPENVVSIGKSNDGRIIWIETGNDDAGLNHILGRHGDQFLSKGFTPQSLSDYVVKLALTGKPVGHLKTNNPTPRVVYEIAIGGKKEYIAISLGSNGFVIGANFVKEGRIIWNESK